MKNGGKRQGAGNKAGSIRPHLTAYWSEDDIKDYFMWLKKAYKKNPRLATWVGDQISGKAMQPIGNPDGSNLTIKFDPIFNAVTPETKTNS